MDRSSRFVEWLHHVPTSRREFLKRSVIMGASAPVFGALLAACGGEDEEDPTEAPAGDPTATRGGVPTAQVGGPTATTGAAEPTATTAAGEPTATEAAEEPTATTGDSGSSGEPTTGGTMVWMGHHELASLSPDDAGPQVHWVIVSQIHNSMLQLDPYYVLQPTLATGYEVSDDGLIYTFTLVEGAPFHDGVIFTSADVKYTFDYYRDPANAMASANDFASIESVEAPDDQTVVITLAGPNAAFLTKTASSMIVPAVYHAEIGEEAYKSAPIGTGPYKIKSWDAANFTEIERFDDCFLGVANIDVIRENIVPEASVRAVALETGEADHPVWPLVTEDNLRFAEDTAYTTQITSSVAINHFPMNNQHPALSDKVVRKAMMHAIDRDSIVEDLWQGAAVKATGNLSPALEFYYNPDVTTYDYDPEVAMSMLDEAGWVVGSDGVREKDGVRLAWTCTIITGDQARGPEAVAVQEWLAAVGMEMSIAEAPVASIQEGQRAGTIDMSLYNWTYGGGDGDPDASTELKSGARNNWSLWENARVDELLDLGLTQTDPDERKASYDEIQEIVAEEVPFLFIKYWDWFMIFNSRVQGMPEDILTSNTYRNAYQWWLDPVE